jgi:peptidoglycan/LPS O-acetylase OafA/YrhL
MRIEIQENEIPAWVRVPAGLVLTGAILLCMAGSITLFVDSPKGNQILGITLGSVFVLLSLWGLDKSLRMVFGWRRRGGLISSTTLKVISLIFLLLPIGGLFTGYYSEKGIVGVLQAFWNVGIFFGIRAFAKSREKRMLNQEDAPDLKPVR